MHGIVERLVRLSHVSREAVPDVNISGQTCMFVLLVHDQAALRAVLRNWRSSLDAGTSGTCASVDGFVALALSPARQIRRVADSIFGKRPAWDDPVDRIALREILNAFTERLDGATDLPLR